MPYYCYIHNGLYISLPDTEGCQAATCLEWADIVVPPLGVMVGTVPGGHNDTHGSAQYKFQSGFDSGLEAYKSARDEGLQPKKTTVEAVRASQEQVRSHTRGLKKAKKMGIDVTQLSVAKGVDTS